MASLGELGAVLNISISRIISAAITKIIKEPAIANDDMSIWNKLKIASPTYKKHKKIKNDAMQKAKTILEKAKNTRESSKSYFKGQLEEKRKTIYELMVLPYYHFDNLFIHERI